MAETYSRLANTALSRTQPKTGTGLVPGVSQSTLNTTAAGPTAGAYNASQSMSTVPGGSLAARGAGMAAGSTLVPDRTPGVAQTAPGASLANVDATVERPKEEETPEDKLNALYDDLLNKSSEREAGIKEAGMANQAFMERQALARAGRANRLITGGGAQGMLAQATIAGNQATQQSLNDWWTRHQGLALSALGAKTDQMRYQNARDSEAYANMASLPEAMIIQAAYFGQNELAQQVADDLGLNWRNPTRTRDTAPTGIDALPTFGEINQTIVDENPDKPKDEATELLFNAMNTL